VPVKALLDPAADLTAHSRVHFLGDVGSGAADPAGLAVAADGTIVAPLGGIGEVAFGRVADLSWRRLEVGARPTTAVACPDRGRVYVANTFDDSIAVLDLAARKVETTIRLGKAAEPSAAERGERLFYDARLSHDGWLSCHSCHPDGHTNGRLNDNLGDGAYGAPKRVLTLLGVGETDPWAWTGIAPDLEGQVRKSIRTTMHGTAPSERQVQDLTAFLRTLRPPPSAARLRGQLDAEAVRRGERVFQRQKCGTCHTPPLYTSRRTYDVGLEDEAGARQFNPPSLRGAGQGGPYFHDGRAATLEDVFARHRHQLDCPLPKQDLADLLAFLQSL
jgi:YVTN family beta-propeller protein